MLTDILHFYRGIINGHFALYPGPINMNGSGMMVLQLQICHHILLAHFSFTVDT